MFTKWLCKRREDRKRRNQQKAEQVLEARREAQHDPRDPDDLGDVEKLAPFIQGIDRGAGPL